MVPSTRESVTRDGPQAVTREGSQKVRDRENQNLVVPAPVIARFLADVKRGRGLPRGLPALGCSFQHMASPALRAAFGLSEGASGGSRGCLWTSP